VAYHPKLIKFSPFDSLAAALVRYSQAPKHLQMNYKPFQFVTMNFKKKIIFMEFSSVCKSLTFISYKHNKKKIVNVLQGFQFSQHVSLHCPFNALHQLLKLTLSCKPTIEPPVLSTARPPGSTRLSSELSEVSPDTLTGGGIPRICRRLNLEGAMTTQDKVDKDRSFPGSDMQDDLSKIPSPTHWQDVGSHFGSLSSPFAL